MNETKTNPLLHQTGAFLRLLGDLLVINLLWIICSLPVVTIGMASSAAYAVLLRRVMHGEIPLLKNWWNAIRKNFWQALALEGILAVLGIAVWGDLQMVISYNGVIRMVYVAACVMLTVSFMVVALFALPQQALFENSLKNVLKNAFALAVCYPGKFLLCCLYWVAVVGSILLLPLDVFQQVGFLWFMWGLSFPAWLTSKVLISIFAKLDPSIKENEDKSYDTRRSKE